MLNYCIEINGCKHYIASQPVYKQTLRKLPQCERWSWNIDKDIMHPLGTVYKVATVIDTKVRYIIQRNGTVLYFNINNWSNEYQRKISFTEELDEWLITLLHTAITWYRGIKKY